MNIILIIGIINITFLEFNLICKIRFTFGNGIPFFIREVKLNQIPYIKKYFLGFMLYNLILMLLSVLVLIRLYGFIILIIITYLMCY